MSPVITRHDLLYGSCVLVERDGRRVWVRVGHREMKVAADPFGLWQFNAWAYEVTEVVGEDNTEL